MKITKYRRFLFYAVLALFVMCAVPSFAALPKDYKEFKARYANEAKTPEGAAKLHFDAIFCYMDPNKREEGSKMLRYSMRLRKDWEYSDLYNIFSSRMEDTDYSHIFRSYAEGATTANGYKMSEDDYKLVIINKWLHKSGDAQVSLQSGGADSPRSIHMQKVDGLWYVSDNSAIYADIRKPLSDLDKTGHDADYDEVNYNVTSPDKGVNVKGSSEGQSLKNKGKSENRDGDWIEDKIKQLILEQLLKHL